MTSVSMKAATTQSILKKVATLKGHGKTIHSISYFPDGQRMISGSLDKTTRQWDLKAGEEIEGARDVCKNKVYVVAVSRDGRWVVTGGGDLRGGELTSCDVKTGIVKIFEGHSREVNTVDISADSTLLASESDDKTVRIWNLETGKLVAGPFKSIGRVGAVRFSPDFKKLAVKLDWGVCLEVWDIQSCRLDVRIGNPNVGGTTLTPVFWTNKNKNIIAAFEFCSTEFQDLYDLAKTIYEFDAVTLETVGTAFEGHTNTIWGLTLSLDGALLASASYDNTIKLWAFVSRELLASFDIQNPFGLMLSSDSLQLVYTTHTKDDYKICICDTPPNILAQARSVHRHLLNSDVTCRPPAGHRRPPISVMPIASRTLPKIDSQQPTFLRLRKLLPFYSGANVVPGRPIQPRDLLDFPATLPLPPNRPPAESSPSTSLPIGRAFFDLIQSSSDKGKQKAREPKRKSFKAVDVPLGQATYGDVVGVDDGVRPFVLFFCLSWFQKKEKKPEPRPVYDDELEDDEDEENVLDSVAVPPPGFSTRKLKPLGDRSQPEPDHLVLRQLTP